MSLNKKLKGILRSNVVEELSSNSNGCQTCMRPQCVSTEFKYSEVQHELP